MHKHRLVHQGDDLFGKNVLFVCVSSHLNVIGLFVHERPLFSFMTSVHLHAPNTGLLWCLNVWLNGSQMSPKVLLILKGLLRSIRNWSSGSIWRKKLRCCSSGVGYRQGIRFLNVYFESLIKSHMCWTVAATTSLCSNVWHQAMKSSLEQLQRAIITSASV